MKLERWMACAAALSLWACDGETPDVDAGGDPDTGVAADAGPMEDAGPDAGNDEDAGGCGCASGEVCLAGVCVEDCGGDLGPSLGAVTPLRSFCRVTEARAYHDGEIWDATTATEAGTTTVTLSRWTPDPDEGITGLEALGTLTYMPTSGMPFFSGYLAVSPDGMTAVVGYTTDEDAQGAVLWRRDGASPRVILSTGNFATAFLDDSTLLVNGLSLGDVEEGQGVYATDVTAETPAGTHVLSNMGAFSGSVAATGEYVIAGGVDGDTFAGTVWAAPRAEVVTAKAGGGAIDVATDATEVQAGGAPIASTFRIVNDRLVTLPFGGPITSYQATWDGSALTLSDPRELATGETFTDVVEADEGAILLVHAAGMLLVE